MKRTVRRVMRWIARRSVFVVTVLLIGLAALLVWFLATVATYDLATVSVSVAALAALFAAISSIAGLLQAVEAQRQREVLERPYVLAYFDGASTGAIYFVVENVGNSPALDVEIEFDPAPVDYSNRPLDEISLFEQPIDFLPPGKSFRQFIDVGHKFLAEGKRTGFRVSVSYDSVHSDSYEHSENYDLAYLKEASVPGKTINDNVAAISKELKELVKLLQRVQSAGVGPKSLLVETPSQYSTRLRHELAEVRQTPRWKRFLCAILRRMLEKLE